MLDWLNTMPAKEEKEPLDDASPFDKEIERMASFYAYSKEEKESAKHGAKDAPEAWEKIILASRLRWSWKLDGTDRHPWLSAQ